MTERILLIGHSIEDRDDRASIWAASNGFELDWRFPFDPAMHAWTLDVSPNYAKLPRTRNVPISNGIRMTFGKIQ